MTRVTANIPMPNYSGNPVDFDKFEQTSQGIERELFWTN